MTTSSGLFDRNVPGMTKALQASVAGIAGCGGIGSNVAVSLTRAGIGRLVLVDHDRVEASNLNRQQFVQADIGRPKVVALGDYLHAIHGGLALDLHEQRLTPDNIALVFANADVLIEAFDRAEEKQWLLEAWCRHFPDRPIVCASGLGGLGRTNDLCVRSSGNIYFCGDGESDMSLGLCASRVGIAAQMQANVAIELLVRGHAHVDRQ